MSSPPSILPQPGQIVAYDAAGWTFVRLHHFAATKTLANGRVMELGKAPIGKKWTKAGVPLVAATAHMNAGRNVGALIPEGWAVIDVDPRAFPEGRQVLSEFARAMGLDLTKFPFVITGTKGRHYFGRIPLDYKGAVKHPDYPGVEFKQIGAQVVTAGSIHPKTHAHYRWAESPTALAEAPEIPASVLELYKLRAPVLSNSRGAGSWNSLTLDQVEDALDKLDPTDFRDQDAWFGLMCSVHWLTGGEGRQLFVDWSISDPEFEDHLEIVEMRWDSLNRDNASGQLVAKGGLLFKALKHRGENPGARQWQLQPEKDFDDYSEDEAKEDAKNVVLLNEAVADEIAVTEGGKIEEMNRKHFVLDHKGKTVVGRIRKEEDDHGSEIVVYTFSDVSSFKNFYANQMIKTAEGPVSLAEWWFHHPQRLTYSKMEFRPDRPAGNYRDSEGLVLNQWTGFALQPKEGDWSYFHDLLENTICGGDPIKLEYMLNWFAWGYQKLDSPTGTALAINGLKGTGKTTVWQVFSAPFGSSHAMATSRMNEVFGDFNGRMMGKAALLIEEALIAASKSANAMLKDLITGGRVSINEKFLPSYSQRNYLRTLIFTNNDYIVEATEDERRFFITKAQANRKGDQVYWDALRKQMFEDGGVNAFFHDMLQRDLSGFNPYSDLPRTRELIEQISITRGAVLDWLMEKFDFGPAEFGYSWQNKRNEFILPITEMWEDFKNWQAHAAKGRYENPIRSQSGFSRELKRIFEDLPLTTATVPDEVAFDIKHFEQRVGHHTYKIAKVYKFYNFEEFEGTFRKRYGLETVTYDPASEELDNDAANFDFGTDEEDLGFGI